MRELKILEPTDRWVLRKFDVVLITAYAFDHRHKERMNHKYFSFAISDGEQLVSLVARLFLTLSVFPLPSSSPRLLGKFLVKKHDPSIPRRIGGRRGIPEKSEVDEQRIA